MMNSMRNLHFRGMSLFIRFRNALSPPEKTLKEQEITSGVAESGLFSLLRKGEKTYTFRKK